MTRPTAPGTDKAGGAGGASHPPVAIRPILADGSAHADGLLRVHELRSLRAALDGELITPDSAAYEAARRPALARFHHVRPIAVVRCARRQRVWSST